MNKLAKVCAIVSVILIVAGATVTSTRAGDSIPDWPLSYKSLIPPLIGNVVYEYFHRVVAAIVAILILALTIGCWITKQSKLVCWLAVSAFIAIILQALLGGLRVLVVSDENVQKIIYGIIGKVHNKDLRLIFAITHAILAQIVLSLTFIIATLTSRKWHDTSLLSRTSNVAKILVVIFIFTIFCQLIVGAIMRHKGIGLIIPDFPTSFGSVIPNFSNLPYNPNASFYVTYDEFKTNVVLNFIHRALAFIILFFTITILLYIKKFYSDNKQLVKLIFVIFLHIIIQIIIGALVVWTQAPTFLTIMHTAVGASILGIGIIFLLWIFHPVKAV